VRAVGIENEAPEVIRVEQLCKVFGAQEARVRKRVNAGQAFTEAVEAEGVVPPLNEVNLSIRQGEIYAIMGLSGSGKSTLVRCINGLVQPTSGRVMVEGASIGEAAPRALRELRQRRMSMVFQTFALLPHLTVAANVEFGLMLRQDEVSARRRRVEDVLAMVDLSAWKDRRVDELSGGMKQRVGLARALAPDPDILIMDEPFSALDPLIRRSLQDELLRLQKELKKTILFVTHDFDEAARIGTRILIMKAGRAVQVGTAAQLFGTPCDEYVRAFTAHADGMQLLTAGDLVRDMPATVEDTLPADATHALVFPSNTPLARMLPELRLGRMVSLEDPQGRSARLVRSERVLEFVGRLYAGAGRTA
jgi:glycine betaine/proline transport system ATP-binding protein